MNPPPSKIAPLGTSTELKLPSVSTNLNIRLKTEPSACVGSCSLTVKGRWFRIATVHDEEWLDGEGVTDPSKFIHQLKTGPVRADLFSFGPGPRKATAIHPYHVEWDNYAALPTDSYQSWSQSLSQDTRRNIRLAAKRGVVLSSVPFDDDLVRGIMGIYNETPFRQGRKFWHFGKDFATVKRENETYLDRSEFLGAYLGAELIGFLKMVRVSSVASIMQILAKNAHQDKKPMNALIAKAVELCEQKGLSQLIYRKFIYDGNVDDPLTEFKRRNGFDKFLVPRYFVPLTKRGAVGLRLGFHRGAKELMPHSLRLLLKKTRRAWMERKSSRAGCAQK